MKILPLHRDLILYLRKRKLEKKFNKQSSFLERDLSYPSLEVELLEPKHFRIFSFRIDRKYRAIFIFHSASTIEIFDINNHYR